MSCNKNGIRDFNPQNTCSCHVIKFVNKSRNADIPMHELCVNMADKRSKTFSSMNVASLKKYLQERGVTVNGYLKPALVEIAFAVEKMMCLLTLIFSVIIITRIFKIV